MTDIVLTSQQKKYLLYLMESDDNNTIVKFSKKFNCSRVNSKKILDKMLKLGVLYKDEKKYRITSFGKNLGLEMYESNEKVSAFLQHIFYTERDIAREYSERMCTELDVDFTKHLKRKADILSRIPDGKNIFTHDEMIEIIGETGDFPIGFVIYKHEAEEDTSNIGFSMANMAFESVGSISIGEENMIILYTKSLTRAQDGYIKEGNLMSFTYMHEGVENNVTIKNSSISLPIEIFSTWMYVGSGIFTSSAWLRSNVSVGINKHLQRSNYTLLLDIAKL